MSLNHDKGRKRVTQSKWAPGPYFRIPRIWERWQHYTGSFFRWNTWKAIHMEECIKKAKNFMTLQLSTIWGRLGNVVASWRRIILQVLLILLLPCRSSRFLGRGRHESQCAVLSAFIDTQMQEAEQSKQTVLTSSFWHCPMSNGKFFWNSTALKSIYFR